MTGLAILCVALFGASSLAWGQGTPGVSEKEIIIGSCAALQGPSSFLGRETVTGAEAHFKMVDEGGVHGRKLRLISNDDSYDPAKAEPCFQKLMSENAFSLGFFVGTPTAVKYVPLAESNKIPVVGLFTGAQTLYTPLRRWIVNVRASYFDETREQMDGLWNTLHYRKIGVMVPEDAFGTAVVGTAIDSLRAANPDAVVVGPSNTVAPILKQAHEKGWKPLFLTV
jgi:branched-chain amino acid transport system substrate-binding protein